MHDFVAQFGAPLHGWMSIQVVAGDQQWNADVSHVPCDSIRSLISSLSMIMQGISESTVDWSLEPDYAHWTFCRNGTSLEFAIKNSKSKIREVVYRGNARLIIHRFIKGLCDLAAEDCWSSTDRPARFWSWQFPAQELLQLKAVYATFNAEIAEQSSVPELPLRQDFKP